MPEKNESSPPRGIKKFLGQKCRPRVFSRNKGVIEIGSIWFGLTFEGIFYNHMIFKGQNRDTAWYSILDDEWPEVCDIMERWLAPSNFDQDGKAKTSLAALMQETRSQSPGLMLAPRMSAYGP